MAKPVLSAVVCAHNEEARLEACLRRLAFADEIVVLLDRCDDGSEAIARRLAHKVVLGAFPLEGPRRAAAVAAASGEWVLEVDADEAISPALAAEISQRVNAPGEADYFQIPVDNYVGQRLVRYGWGGSFGTSSVARLFRNGIKTWGDEQVHPTTRFAGVQGRPLTQPLEHDVDRDVTDMLQRFDRYTALRAQDLAVRPKGGVISNVFRAMRRFWKCYVSRKGYREGDWGFLIALLAALYPLVSTLRARLDREISAPAGKA